MSKLQQIVLGVFCMGVLLCGIGAGVAFVEFSGLSYGGIKYLGEEEMVTRNLDVPFEPTGAPLKIEGYYEGYYVDGIPVEELKTDASVPENTVRLKVTYNASLVSPEADIDTEIGWLSLYCIWNKHVDMALFMEAKDEVLKELREGRIPTIATKPIEAVTVLVNPANQGDVSWGR